MWIDQRGSEVVVRAECLRLVAMSAAAGSVGRLAVSGDGAPLLQPVNFAYVEGRVLLRIGEGLMWRRAVGSLVAFEVDGTVDGVPAPYAWSVVVRGLATSTSVGEVPPAGVLPAPAVPAPGDRLLAVRPDVVTGRRFPLRARAAAVGQMATVAGARHAG